MQRELNKNPPVSFYLEKPKFYCYGVKFEIEEFAIWVYAQKIWDSVQTLKKKTGDFEIRNPDTDEWYLYRTSDRKILHGTGTDTGEALDVTDHPDIYNIYRGICNVD